MLKMLKEFYRTLEHIFIRNMPYIDHNTLDHVRGKKMTHLYYNKLVTIKSYAFKLGASGSYL
jgi:hypothetical protein